MLPIQLRLFRGRRTNHSMATYTNRTKNSASWLNTNHGTMFDFAVFDQDVFDGGGRTTSWTNRDRADYQIGATFDTGIFDHSVFDDTTSGGLNIWTNRTKQ